MESEEVVMYISVKQFMNLLWYDRAPALEIENVPLDIASQIEFEDRAQEHSILEWNNGKDNNPKLWTPFGWVNERFRRREFYEKEQARIKEATRIPSIEEFQCLIMSAAMKGDTKEITRLTNLMNGKAIQKT